MFISVSTSFYKRAHLVEKVYEQLKQQTFTNWEWVVTDDFSEENSAEQLLKQLARQDHRIKYYRQSRKKELFFNPHFGCKGDIVVQVDTDDEMFPKLLETYNYTFTKFPELMGASVGWNAYTTSGKWVHCSVHDDSKHKIWEPHAPMARAFKNVFKTFDEGQMKFYMNDTNIVRHTENYGKFMFIPRWLYNYMDTEGSISKSTHTPEELDELKAECEFIDNQFPRLTQQQGSSHLPYYYSINMEAFSLLTAQFNKANTAQKILYLNTQTKPYQRDLIRDLFFDHYISFDINEREKFDEIVISLNSESVKTFEQDIAKIKYYNSNIPITIHFHEFYSGGMDVNYAWDVIGRTIGGYSWDTFYHHTFVKGGI